VRRAEYLRFQQDYRQALIDARGRWNAKFPQFRVIQNEIDPQMGPPPALRQAHYATAQRRGTTGEAWPTDDEYMATPELGGWWEWSALVFDLTRRFFPWRDFPNPYQPETLGDGPAIFFITPSDGAPPDGGMLWLADHMHPAYWFVSASMYKDPRLIDDMGQLIHIPELRVEPMRDARTESDEPAPFDWKDQPYCIPIYPGITAKDLIDAAPELARQAEEYFGTRTVGSRVRALRAKGLTYQQIADRLGLTPQTVANTLSGANGATESDEIL